MPSLSDARERAVHEQCLTIAKAAWTVIALAHGDESPLDEINAFREYPDNNGHMRPIPDRSLTMLPSVLGGAILRLQQAMGEWAAIEEAGVVKIDVGPDGASIHEGAGGVFGASWHEVAHRLFVGVYDIVNFAFPLNKIPVIVGATYLSKHPGDRTEEEWNAIWRHHVPEMPEPVKDGQLITPATVSRVYQAIRRKFTQFNIGQLTARMEEEYEPGRTEEAAAVPSEPTPTADGLSTGDAAPQTSQAPAVNADEAAHNTSVQLAICTWRLVAMAHGQDAPLYREHPLGDSHLLTTIQSPDGPFNTSFEAFLTATVEFRNARTDFLKVVAQKPLIPRVRDEMALNVGSGGRFADTWLDVVIALATDVSKIIDRVVPVAKILIPPTVFTPTGTGPGEELVAALPESARPHAAVLTLDMQAKAYEAIKRAFTTYNINQLIARMRAEFEQGKQRMSALRSVIAQNTAASSEASANGNSRRVDTACETTSRGQRGGSPGPSEGDTIGADAPFDFDSIDCEFSKIFLPEHLATAQAKAREIAWQLLPLGSDRDALRYYILRGGALTALRVAACGAYLRVATFPALAETRDALACFVASFVCEERLQLDECYRRAGPMLLQNHKAIQFLGGKAPLRMMAPTAAWGAGALARTIAQLVMLELTLSKDGKPLAELRDEAHAVSNDPASFAVLADKRKVESALKERWAAGPPGWLSGLLCDEYTRLADEVAKEVGAALIRLDAISFDRSGDNGQSVQAHSKPVATASAKSTPAAFVDGVDSAPPIPGYDALFHKVVDLIRGREFPFQNAIRRWCAERTQGEATEVDPRDGRTHINYNEPIYPDYGAYYVGDERYAMLGAFHDSHPLANKKISPWDLASLGEKVATPYAALVAAVGVELDADEMPIFERLYDELSKELRASIAEPALGIGAGDNATGKEQARARNDIENEIHRIAAAVGDENTAEILRIAANSESAEERMVKIIRLDRRWLGKGSPEWSNILKVDSSAVRQTAIWKHRNDANWLFDHYRLTQS